MVSIEGVEIGSEVEIKWAAHLLQLSVTGIKKARPFKSTGLVEKNTFFILKKLYRGSPLSTNFGTWEKSY